MDYSKHLYYPASHRLKRSSWIDPARDGYHSQPQSPRDVNFHHNADPRKHQYIEKDYQNRSRSTHGTPRNYRKEITSSSHYQKSSSLDDKQRSFPSNLSTVSVGNADHPDVGSIIRGYEVNLESPLFFTGDNIRGQVLFNLFVPAQLLRLQINIRGAVILRSSCHKIPAHTKIDEILNKTELLFESNLNGTMDMKPGRYIFDINTSVPSSIPSTNSVVGNAADKKFRMVVEYYVQSRIEFGVHGLQPRNLEYFDIKSVKKPFHVEQNIEKDLLLPVSIPFSVKDKGRLRIRMARNTFKIGDVVEVDVEIGNGYANFGMARLELLQNIRIVPIQHQQTTVLLVQNKEFAWSDRMIYSEESPRSNTDNPRYYCRFELKLDERLKTSFKFSFCSLIYILHLKIKYGKKEILNFEVPIYIQRVIHQKASARVSPTIFDQSQGIKIDGKVIRENGPCLAEINENIYISKFPSEKNASTCNIM